MHRAALGSSLSDPGTGDITYKNYDVRLGLYGGMQVMSPSAQSLSQLLAQQQTMQAMQKIVDTLPIIVPKVIEQVVETPIIHTVEVTSKKLNMWVK